MSRSIRLLSLAIGAVLLVTLPSGAATAATSGCAGYGVPLRLPASPTLGVVALTAAAGTAGTVAISRYRSGTDYLYVSDAASRRAAETAGYSPDGETLRASATPAPGCTVRVYQLQRGQAHRLAVGGAGVAALTKAGWGSARALFSAADPPGRARAVASGPVAGALPAHDEDAVFRMVVLPDTQEEVHTDADSRLRKRAEYIAAHREDWDIRLAVSVGDIGDWDTPDHAQYARAAQQLQPLVRAVPFVAAVGNHDTQAACPGGSACPGLRASTTVRDTTVFNTYFPARDFSLLRGEYEPGKIDNAYHTFRAGDADWLVLNLELWPRTQVVDWAARVVAANPRRNVIVVTHSYLTRGGNIKGDNGGYGSTSPKYLYDHVVKAYPNVKIVLSGHTGKDKMRIDKGKNGNRVVSYLQCFHSRTANPFRRLSIDTDRGTISSAIFTPSTGKRVNNAKATKVTFIR